MFGRQIFAGVFLVGGSMAAGHAVAGFEFLPGHIYTTHYNDNVIHQYDAEGGYQGSLAVADVPALRGLAYHDGLMYAAVNGGWNDDLSVVAFDADGLVVEEYHSDGRIAGNLSYGKISFDDNGGFYVGQGTGLMHFNVGEPDSGVEIYGSGVFDVKVLPAGEVMIATSYDIHVLDASGTVLRTVDLDDPDNIAGGAISFTDIRGLEYSEPSDTLYVSMLGHSGQFFSLMKLNAGTGALQAITNFHYGDDLQLLADQSLLVGSRSQTPGLFSSELEQGAALGTNSQMFVTTIAVESEPEPEPENPITAVVQNNSDWGAGYCASLSVTNNGDTAAEWVANVAVEGTVYTLWNGVWQQSGGDLEVSGVGWNSVIYPGQTLSSMGFCANR